MKIFLLSFGLTLAALNFLAVVLVPPRERTYHYVLFEVGVFCTLIGMFL